MTTVEAEREPEVPKLQKVHGAFIVRLDGGVRPFMVESKDGFIGYADTEEDARGLVDEWAKARRRLRALKGKRG